jgi:hypothetical protein
MLNSLQRQDFFSSTRRLSDENLSVFAIHEDRRQTANAVIEKKDNFEGNLCV